MNAKGKDDKRNGNVLSGIAWGEYKLKSLQRAPSAPQTASKAARTMANAAFLLAVVANIIALLAIAFAVALH